MLKRRASLLAGQALVFAAFFGLWELAVRLLHTRPVILPAPSVIFAKIWEQRELLLVNTWPTCEAITLGFAAAVLSGFILAVGISYSRAVRELTYPFLVTAQVLPKVAFAPLFLIWFGFGLTPKVVIAALIAFFPIVINTAKGLSSVEAELLQYMDSLGATGREKFLKISLPWALPYIFAAFKISITLAIVGAVVGEFVAAGEGLGYVINRAMQQYRGDQVYAVALLAALLSFLVYSAVHVIGRRLDWQGAARDRA